MARVVWKLLIYTLCSLAFSSYARGQSMQVRHAEGELIVKLRQSSKGSDNEYKFLGKAQLQKGLSLKAQWRGMGMFHFKGKKGDDLQATLNELRQDPDVEYAEPNYLFEKANITENESLSFKTLSEVSAMSGSYMATGAPIEAQEAWSIMSPSAASPVIAIIDTGLDISHSVFASTGAVWVNSGEIPGNGIDDDHNGYIDDVNGWNFVSHSAAMFDDDGHGTHVAGIVLGTTQDIFSPPLSAAKIRIMPLKFLDGMGVGKTSDAIEAIYYAVNNGAKVMNNSWGGPSYSTALHQAIDYAYNHGVLFVAAAGNNASNNDSAPMYPASYNVPNVLSVAATTSGDGLAYFSNFGKTTVDMGSPGSGILSTYPGEYYVSMSGTSMATPFVTGMAALIKREKPSMLAYQLKSIIAAEGDQTPSLMNKTKTEHRLNVYEALVVGKAATVDSSQPAYTFSSQGRDLASSLAASGCGQVTKLGTGGGGGPQTWYVLLVIGLLLAPLAIWKTLRKEDPSNRRQHDRYKIDTEVKLNLDGRELIGSISSIGLGGVQLNTNALLENGGLVRMSIVSPNGEEMVEVEGRVVWSEANSAYGVRFEEAKQTVLERIQSWTLGLVKN